MSNIESLERLIESFDGREEQALGVAIVSQTETKVRRTRNIFGGTEVLLHRLDGTDRPIYGLKIYVESAPGVWLDVLPYSLKGLREAVKEAQKKGDTPKKVK